MSRSRDDRTYRVRQLPQHVSLSTLAEFLVAVDSSLGPADNITVWSIAEDPALSRSSSTQTATVTFKPTPLFLDSDGPEWIIRVRDLSGPKAKLLRLEESVLFDTHFLGCTPLNDVDERLHTFDCIAISGLASHPFGSWKQRDVAGKKHNFMWLRDQLPKDMRFMRIILYGYDTRLLNSHSVKTIENVAINLVESLRSIGRSLVSSKPVVFLAHSLGGIVLKNALVEMARAEERTMLDAIHAMILFGVPNRGMSTSHLMAMVKSQPNEHLIRDLALDSDYLSELQKSFANITGLRRIRIVSVFETQETQVPLEISPGVWKAQAGPFEYLVPQVSATSMSLPETNNMPSQIVSIDRNHSEMVKFEESSHEYLIILQKIRDLCTAPNGIGAEDAISGTSVTTASGLTTAYTTRSTTDAQIHAVSRNDTARLQPASDSHTDKDERDAVLQSLEIPESLDRFDQIDEASTDTFSWVWTNETLGLEEWLKNDQPAYWIRGKPGSGKSTLMKYVVQTLDEQAESFLDMDVVVVPFFFHNRGSDLQRSFEGLLRSILHTLLDKDPSFLDPILKVYYARKRVTKFQSGTLTSFWNRLNLQKAFERVLQHQNVAFKPLLILDALDEYHGSVKDIIKWITNLAKRNKRHAVDTTKIKLLFSSRPWNEFIDAFSTYPGFDIRNHTQDDITALIYGRFEENPGVTEILNSEHEQTREKFAALIQDILLKADGVILWVKIVLDNLIALCEHGALWSDIEKSLAAFPPDLEALYVNVIERLDPEFRAEGYFMLEIVSRSGGMIRMKDFWDAVLCVPKHTLAECARILEDNDSGAFPKEAALRRLRSRSGGLLEMTHFGYDHFFIQVMHQTVKEFIQSPKLRETFSTFGVMISVENGYSFLSKSGIALEFMQCKQGWNHDESLYNSLIASNAYFSERTTGRSQKHLLDELSLLYHPRRLQVGVPHFETVFDFGVWASLRLYVQETLLSEDDRKLHPQGKPLHYCILAMGLSDHFQEFKNVQASTDEQLEMLRLLLKNGADTSAQLRGDTPYQALFASCTQAKRSGEGPGLSSIMEMVAIELIAHGQDPNVEISISAQNDRHELMFWIEAVEKSAYEGTILNKMREDYKKKSNERTTCKVLHLVNLPISRALFQSGKTIDVNALDSSGYTPLDVCIGALRAWEAMFDTVDFPTAVAMTKLLLDHGACLTKRGKEKLEDFVQDLEQRYPDFTHADYFRSAPVLEDPEQFTAAQVSEKIDKDLNIGKDSDKHEDPGPSQKSAKDKDLASSKDTSTSKELNEGRDPESSGVLDKGKSAVSVKDKARQIFKRFRS